MSYGLAASMMSQQAHVLALMDCFRLPRLAVIIGLPLAFFIRRFEIGKGEGAAHREAREGKVAQPTQGGFPHVR